MRTRAESQAEFTWLTPAEFGRRAGGIHADTVIRDIRRGEIAGVVKLRGGAYRIPPDEVQRWLERHAVVPEGDRGAA